MTARTLLGFASLSLTAPLVAAMTATLALANTPQIPAQLQTGLQAIRSLAGCYLVDYSFVETESLQSGYVRDPRVYDVNRDKSIKEWIVAQEITPTRIRLQHILFGADLNGNFMPGSLLKHQAEDWEYSAAFSYEFIAPLTWDVQNHPAGNDFWTRRITNLDDGLRHQCTAQWLTQTAFPEWSCANYAPIPGRETRDMGRKDYNTLDRSTRVIAYGNSWLERQNNVKTIHSPQGLRSPLAREEGKTWYVRLPDSECADAQAFAKAGQPFWNVLRQAWDEVLVGDRPFLELAATPGQASRYSQILDIEDLSQTQDLNLESNRRSIISSIQAVISSFRKN